VAPATIVWPSDVFSSQPITKPNPINRSPIFELGTATIGESPTEKNSFTTDANHLGCIKYYISVILPSDASSKVDTKPFTLSDGYADQSIFLEQFDSIQRISITQPLAVLAASK
jgi:hypothetical protein